MIARRIWKDRKALSTVVATLIILVSSVVSAAAVAVYSTSLTQSRSETESLNVRLVNIWVNSTVTNTPNPAVAAFVVSNTGGLQTALSSIVIRGKAVPIGDIYFWKPTVTVNSLSYSQTALNANATAITISVEGAGRTFTQATGAVGLNPGDVVVLYIDGTKTNISKSDPGTSANISLLTPNAITIAASTVASV